MARRTLLLALMAELPVARGIGVDISEAALGVARANAEDLALGGRTAFLCGDWAEAVAGVFDIVVSNPPYIAAAEIETLQPEVRDFDPRMALDGGADGLDFYRRLAKEAAPFLKPDGKIMVEFGDGQAEGIRKIFEAEKWIVEAVREDYSHRARILVTRI